MPRIRPLSLALFFAGYALHVAMVLAADDRLALPIGEALARMLALAGILLAAAMVWRELARSDEVRRRFALTACAVSFVGTASLSYLSSLWGMPRLAPADSLWAFALLLWLVSFAFLEARARW